MNLNLLLKLGLVVKESVAAGASVFGLVVPTSDFCPRPTVSLHCDAPSAGMVLTKLIVKSETNPLPLNLI
jgi:hypothetical protein